MNILEFDGGVPAPSRQGSTAARLRETMIGPVTALLALTAYLCLPAAVINGDGLKYLYAVHSNDVAEQFQPGHLLYCPFMAVLSRSAAPSYLAGARAMQLCDQVAGAIGVYLLVRTVRRLGLGAFAQWAAGLGLAFSYGYWIAATDVETYALATMLVIASLHGMAVATGGATTTKAAALGILNGLAALFHLASIALIPASLVLIALAGRRRPAGIARSLAAYTLSLAVVLVLPLLAVGAGLLGHRSAGEFVGWLRSSDHGLRASIDALSLPRAAYGFARTFLYMEFYWSAPKWVILLKGVALLAAGAWALRRLATLPRGNWRGLGSLAVAASPFLALQVVLGVCYFGSDTERWILIAPLVWLAIAAFLDRLTPIERRASALALVLAGALNAVQAFWPAAVDTSTRDKVLALDRAIPRGATVITPGQDWTSYYHLYTGKRMDRITLMELASKARIGNNTIYVELMKLLIQRNYIIIIRIIDESDDDHGTPWQELAALGYPPREVRRWFRGFDWGERRLDDPGRTRAFWLRRKPSDDDRGLQRPDAGFLGEQVPDVSWSK